MLPSGPIKIRSRSDRLSWFGSTGRETAEEENVSMHDIRLLIEVTAKTKKYFVFSLCFNGRAL